MSTPKSISSGIKRLFECTDGEGVPNSCRIIQDCDKAWDSMWTVYENKGAIVPGLADRNGIRYSKSGTGKWGGKRVKGEMTSGKWLENGAQQAKLEAQLGISSELTSSDDSDDDSV